MKPSRRSAAQFAIRLCALSIALSHGGGQLFFRTRRHLRYFRRHPITLPGTTQQECAAEQVPQPMDTTYLLQCDLSLVTHTVDYAGNEMGASLRVTSNGEACHASRRLPRLRPNGGAMAGGAAARVGKRYLVRTRRCC